MKSTCVSTAIVAIFLMCILSSEIIEASKGCRTRCLLSAFKCKREKQAAAKTSYDMELAMNICCNKYIACQTSCGIENPSCGMKGKRGSWNKRFEYDPFAESESYGYDLY